MPTYHPSALLTDHQPAPWGDAVPITYTQRDVLLYAVGIGCDELRFVYEGHPQFAVFPTFAIRWGGAGLMLDASALPPSPGPLTIDAERCIHCGQMLLGALCGGDPARFEALKVRFSSPVMPGDALRVIGWKDRPGRVIFEARVGDRVVVSNAYFNHR